MSLLGLAGRAGSGKDTVARMLVDNFPGKVVVISLADPLKRFIQAAFGFEPDQLWGSTERRAEKSARFPDGPTAREALQQLGTEWGRRLHPDVWVRHAIRTARAVQAGQGDYDCREWQLGSSAAPPPRLIVIPDVRFDNELATIQEASGGDVWLIRRPATETLPGGIPNHASEVGIPVERFNRVLNNTGTLKDLEVQVLRLARGGTV